MQIHWVFFQKLQSTMGESVNQKVSFAIQKGERIVLDGKNGSGKSSLLKLLNGEKTG